MQYPFETKVRVRYRDVDMQGVVHNSHYLHYGEIARIEYLRHRGLPYQEVVKAYNLEMIVAESHCYYKTPARFDDLLTIGIGVGDIRKSAFKVEYEFTRESTGDQVAVLRTHHVCVDRQTFRPVRIPEEVLELFHQDEIRLRGI